MRFFLPTASNQFAEPIVDFYVRRNVFQSRHWVMTSGGYDALRVTGNFVACIYPVLSARSLFLLNRKCFQKWFSISGVIYIGLLPVPFFFLLQLSETIWFETVTRHRKFTKSFSYRGIQRSCANNGRVHGDESNLPFSFRFHLVA